MAATTLIDVYDALETGQYRQAVQNLQVVLETNPSADAWYLAAELTLEKDRDKAIRHLKRALLLNPKHGNSLTLLGQLGELKNLTLQDVAEEISDTVGEHADRTPLLRRLSRTQQMIVIALGAMAITAGTIFGLAALFRPDRPANLADHAPAAAQVEMLRSRDVFSQFTNGSRIPVFSVEQTTGTATPGKETLSFAVPSISGGLFPVHVIVYDSISELIRDRNTHTSLENGFEVRVAQNVLLAYSSSLAGQSIEQELIDLFEVITGM